MIVTGAHRRCRGTDCADHRSSLIANGCTNTDHARQKFLAIERIAVSADNAQRFDQRGKFGDRLVGEALHAVRENASHFIFGEPSQYGFAERCRVRRFHLPDSAGVDAHRVACLANRKRYHRITLQSRKMHGFSGRLVDRFKIALRAARQVDLQTRVSEIKDARAEGIKPATRHLRGKAALDQRSQQMVAGGDVEVRARGKLGERRLAAGLGDRFQQVECAINRLDVVTVTRGMSPPWTSFGTRSGQNCCFHCVSPCR